MLVRGADVGRGAEILVRIVRCSEGSNRSIWLGLVLVGDGDRSTRRWLESFDEVLVGLSCGRRSSRSNCGRQVEVQRY